MPSCTAAASPSLAAAALLTIVPRVPIQRVCPSGSTVLRPHQDPFLTSSTNIQAPACAECFASTLRCPSLPTTDFWPSTKVISHAACCVWRPLTFMLGASSASASPKLTSRRSAYASVSSALAVRVYGNASISNERTRAPDTARPIRRDALASSSSNEERPALKPISQTCMRRFVPCDSHAARSQVL